MLQSPSGISYQLVCKFSINQLRGQSVNVLSVFKDKILVSHNDFAMMFIFRCEGGHQLTIPIANFRGPCDTTWTPLGNIVYTTYENYKLVVVSQTGDVVIARACMNNLGYLSVASDDTIYLVEVEVGVYESTDDGTSWSLVFKLTDRQLCRPVIKVITEYSEDFWTIENNDSNSYQLRVYSVDNKRSKGYVTLRNVGVNTSNPIDLQYSSLSFDNKKHIFLSDPNNKAVYVISVDGQYQCQLFSDNNISNKPFKLVFDGKRQNMYVGQDESMVEVFKLAYGDNSASQTLCTY